MYSHGFGTSNLPLHGIRKGSTVICTESVHAVTALVYDCTFMSQTAYVGKHAEFIRIY